MSTVLHNISTSFTKATFGMGCFWAGESLFGGTKGILRTCVGYSGGSSPNPTYKNIGDHTEVIELDYDPNVIQFEQLLQLFWDNHEYGLTTKIKTQYTSLILYHNEEQKKISEESMKKEAEKRKEHLITRIEPAGPFYPAEDYHQKYRLQQYSWLCEAIGLRPELLHTSHVAARLNGYVAGVGKSEEVTDDLEVLGLSDKVKGFVKKLHMETQKSGLFC